jgi:hypothetical protein
MSSSSPPILYPPQYTVPVSTVYSAPLSPSFPCLGFFQYPDGRQVPVAPLYSDTLPYGGVESLRAQLAKALMDNQVLRLVWQAAQLRIRTSTVKEAESQRELQSAREEVEKIRAELEREKKSKEKYVVQTALLQKRIEIMDATFQDNQRQMQFARMNYSHRPCTVGYKGKKNPHYK